MNDATFAAAHGWSEGGSVAIRMFGEGSLFSDIAEELGLSNAWTGKVDEWGADHDRRRGDDPAR